MAPRKRHIGPNRQPRRDSLLLATAGVITIGLALLAVVWTLLTRLTRHHWPWYAGLERGATPPTELDLTKVVLSVIAGVGAAVALTVAYRRQRDTERGRFNEQFAAAATQLGGASAAERIAGVYAISALADQHSDRRQQCINLLCAYLRLPYDPGGGLLHTTVIEQTWKAEDKTHREQRTEPPRLFWRLGLVEPVSG